MLTCLGLGRCIHRMPADMNHGKVPQWMVTQMNNGDIPVDADIDDKCEGAHS